MSFRGHNVRTADARHPVGESAVSAEGRCQSPSVGPCFTLVAVRTELALPRAAPRRRGLPADTPTPWLGVSPSRPTEDRQTHSRRSSKRRTGPADRSSARYPAPRQSRPSPREYKPRQNGSSTCPGSRHSLESGRRACLNARGSARRARPPASGRPWLIRCSPPAPPSRSVIRPSASLKPT